MVFLYLEPMIYVPYELSLRKMNSIVLKEFYIVDGDPLPIEGLSPKRMPNKNYIFFQFDTPLYIEISELVGTDAVLSFVVHYELVHGDKMVSVRHRVNIAFTERKKRSSLINHFNIKHACPAIYGLEGKHIIDNGGLPSGSSKHREIIQFGLDGECHEGRRWAIETFDMLYPFEELRHRILH